MVAQEPRRPRVRFGQRIEVLDHPPERVGVPGQEYEHEVVCHVQLVATTDVVDHPPQVEQVHLPDDHPVRVLVDHPPDPAQALVRGLPVLIVAAVGAGVAAQQRIVGQALEGVDPRSVHTAVEPEPENVVHRRLDLGVVPVEVGLLGREGVQIPLARRLVEGPGRTDGGELGLPVVGRPAVR